MNDGLFNVVFSPEQIQEIADFLHITDNIYGMEDWEIGEMIDNFIDNALM